MNLGSLPPTGGPEYWREIRQHLMRAKVDIDRLWGRVANAPWPGMGSPGGQAFPEPCLLFRGHVISNNAYRFLVVRTTNGLTYPSEGNYVQVDFTGWQDGIPNPTFLYLRYPDYGSTFLGEMRYTSGHQIYSKVDISGSSGRVEVTIGRFKWPYVTPFPSYSESDYADGTIADCVRFTWLSDCFVFTGGSALSDPKPPDISETIGHGVVRSSTLTYTHETIFTSPPMLSLRRYTVPADFSFIAKNSDTCVCP